jgi:UDP-N-acetyl-D-galactosamine dehydrogenase
VLGLSFKENVPDVRNSKVIDIVRELESFGVSVQVHDPVVDAGDAAAEYGLTLLPRDALKPAVALIIAVAHRAFIDEGWRLTELLQNHCGVVLDVRSILPRDQQPAGIALWRL